MSPSGRARGGTICWRAFAAGCIATTWSLIWARIAICIATAAASSSGRITPEASSGYDTPELVKNAAWRQSSKGRWNRPWRMMRELPTPGAHYLLPFGARSRFLFKMDFAEAEYISKLRSGVKGHFSYRNIAWQMKCKMEELEPELGRLIDATPPWVEDPLTR